MSFETLGLPEAIVRALSEAGITEPTPIQAQAIPEAMAGHDLLASAQTGTGKTAAFMLPSLARLTAPSAVKSRGPRVLVLTPTRELAQQVADATRQYGKNIRLNTATILGGMPYHVQFKMLSRPVDVMVATPGRLIDHLNNGKLDFSRLEVLILDEADRMLDMGFIEDVERIAAATPANRQTLLFSATVDNRIASLAKQLLNAPKRIEATARTVPQTQIEQRLFYVDDLAHKMRLLQHLLEDKRAEQAVIFTATKRDADDLAEVLKDNGHRAAALHGDMSQNARNRVIQKMRRGDVKMLVATDVAARGLDIAGLPLVVNFDLPRVAEDYVHRIGRTGRAGASGVAMSFASPRDIGIVKRIERYTSTAIPTHVVEGFEPRVKQRTGAPGGKRPGGWRNGAPSRFSRDGQPQGDRGARGDNGGRPFGNDRAGRGFGGDRPAGDRGPRGFGGDRPQRARDGFGGDRPQRKSGRDANRGY